MKKVSSALALASFLFAAKSSAVSFNDVQFWTGSGTNRAALVVEWNAPESFGGTTVPAPVANKSLVWGYRFNGAASGTQMLKAILAADSQLYVVVGLTFGTYVQGIGYNLAGDGGSGIRSANVTNFFTTNFVTNATVSVDAATPLNSGDLYWSGYYGPNWEVWTETGGAGGFLNSPDRGTNAYWTSTDPLYASSGFHGQWELAQFGLDGLALTNGSWVGFSVAAAAYDSDLSAPYNAHKRAPAAPDASITTLIKNFSGQFSGGEWQAKFSSRSHWLYALERTADLQNWSLVTNGFSGNGTNLILTDAAPPLDKSFYRVRAEQP